MALVKISNVCVRGVSACAPSMVEDNIKYPFYDKGEFERIFPTIGIERRHILKKGQTCADLALKAAEKLLKDLEWEKETIDLLVFCSPSRDFILPDTACLIQSKMGLPKTTMSFDMTLGCTGWTYGLTTVCSLLQSGCLKRALLLNGNMGSSENSYTDKTAYPVAGDMGSATAVEYNEDTMPIWCELGTDGQESIIIRDGGRRNPVTEDSLIQEEFEGGVKRSRLHIDMDWMNVFSFDLKRAPLSFEEVLKYAGKNEDEIDYYLFQQSNYYAVKKIIKKLKLPLEKAPLCLKDFGTTGASCIPLIIVTELAEKLRHGKHNILACSFGVGFSWASVCLSTENLIVPKLQLMD